MEGTLHRLLMNFPPSWFHSEPPFRHRQPDCRYIAGQCACPNPYVKRIRVRHRDAIRNQNRIKISIPRIVRERQRIRIQQIDIHHAVDDSLAGEITIAEYHVVPIRSGIAAARHIVPVQVIRPIGRHRGTGNTNPTFSIAEATLAVKTSAVRDNNVRSCNEVFDFVTGLFIKKDFYSNAEDTNLTKMTNKESD